MGFDDSELLATLRDALRNLLEYDHQRWQPIPGGPRPFDEFKVSELPEFVGSIDPEDYLDWEREIEQKFDFKDLSDEKRCKYAILKLSKGASLWFEGVKAQRARAVKPKITSWNSLKRKLRKRYVPNSQRLTLYRKIDDLVQGKLSVSDYIDAFESLALMDELEENEEQKMSRFLRGLNRNIANSVELCPYADFDSLCGLCLKIEAKGKSKNAGDNGDSSKSDVLPNVEFSSSFRASNSSPNAAIQNMCTPAQNVPYKAAKGMFSTAQNAIPKAPSAAKEMSLSKVHCFRCQGFGHYHNECPNMRTVTLRDAVAIREELLDEEERLGHIFNLKEPEEEEEVVETYEAPIFDTEPVLYPSHAEPDLLELELGEPPFETKLRVGDEYCAEIIEEECCTEGALREKGEQLALRTTELPTTYALPWFEDGLHNKGNRPCISQHPVLELVVCEMHEGKNKFVWHKRLLRITGTSEMVLEFGGCFNTRLNWLLINVVHIALFFVAFVFDPGPTPSQELRTILFEGGGDDPRMESSIETYSSRVKQHTGLTCLARILSIT